MPPRVTGIDNNQLKAVMTTATAMAAVTPMAVMAAGTSLRQSQSIDLRDNNQPMTAAAAVT